MTIDPSQPTGDGPMLLLRKEDVDEMLVLVPIGAAIRLRLMGGAP